MAELTEIEKLRALIVKNAVRLDVEEPDSVNVGHYWVLLAENSDLTARKLKNAIERAHKGVNQNLTIKELIEPESGVSYTTLGVWLGDQGLALALLGLGKLVGLWDVVLPQDTGVTDPDLISRMIGMGFIMLKVGPDSILLK